MIIDVPLVLDALGIEYSEHGSELNALCPGHIKMTGRRDNSPSWWINQDSGQHICFSCGYKGNLVMLVAEVMGFYKQSWGGPVLDLDTARTWLANIQEVPMEKLLEMIQNLPSHIQPAPKPLEMSEARLAVFVQPPESALSKRNITAESASTYGVLWDDKKNNWVLPLREPHLNRLLGWQEKGTIERTFFNRPTGLPKSKTLFGIENQNDTLAIVVESPLDCLRVYSAGITGAVAICGSSPSEEQVKLLRYSQKIVAAFDNDKAGHKASKELLEWSRKYGLNLFFFNYNGSSKKDPGDMTDEEIAWGIENAISSLFGEAAYVQGNAEALSS